MSKEEILELKNIAIEVNKKKGSKDDITEDLKDTNDQS